MPSIRPQFGFIGIYNSDTGKLLEKCPTKQVPDAENQWATLGYKTERGPAFPHLLTLPVISAIETNN